MIWRRAAQGPHRVGEADVGTAHRHRQQKCGDNDQ
jgi:hypothetical protein